MSLYKNIGPITFKAETKNVQIFLTQQYWLMQLKSEYVSNIWKKQQKICSDSVLKAICEKYNKYLQDNVMNVYGQNNKPSSLIMNRNYIEEWNFQNSMNIEMFCEVCKALIKSFQIANEKSISGQIEKCMFFRNLYTGEGFYLNFENQFQQRNVQNIKNNQKQLIKTITTFLQRNFAKGIEVCYKLLITKLKKCTELTQMKDQLQYFQKIYQIKSREVNKKIRNQHQQELSNLHQNYVSLSNQQQQFLKESPIKKSHRIYRKKSEQLSQQRINHKKKSGSSEHRQPVFKKSINLSNLHKLPSQSLTTQRQPKFSMFLNRNKSSNAVHSNFSCTNRSQYINAFKSSKGSLFHSKSNSKNKNKMINTSADKFFKNSYSTTFNQTSMSSMAYSNSTVSKNSQKLINYKQQQQIKKQATKQIQLPQRAFNDQPDQVAMKQIINKNLKMWKDKRMKNNAYFLEKHLSPKQINSKSIKRKNKNSKIEADSMKMICQNFIENKKIDSPIKNSVKQERNIDKFSQFKQQNQKSVKNLKQKQYTNVKYEKYKKTSIPSELNSNQIQISRIENKIQSGRPTQPHNRITQDELEQIQLVLKNTDHEQTQRGKCSTIKKDLPEAQKLTTTVSTKQNPSQNKQEPKNSKAIQKQKTTRKNNMTVSQVIQQAFLKNAKSQLAKLDLVGQCVAKCPKYMSQLGLGDKYLWQLPAFMLYKEFYNRRVQVQQNLKTQCSKTKTQKQQAMTLVKQMEQQNQETKQSLKKLLKVTMKKLKKCELEPQTQQQVKNCLNLDFSRKDYQKLDEITSNFISQMQQARQQNPKVLSFEIQFIDAYTICRGNQFNIQMRENINVEDYDNNETICYFKRRISEVCEVFNTKK